MCGLRRTFNRVAQRTFAFPAEGRIAQFRPNRSCERPVMRRASKAPPSAARLLSCVHWIGHSGRSLALGLWPWVSATHQVKLNCSSSCTGGPRAGVGVGVYSGLTHRFQELGDDQRVGQYCQLFAPRSTFGAFQNADIKYSLEKVSPFPCPSGDHNGQRLAAACGLSGLGASGLLNTLDQIALGLQALFFAYRFAVATHASAHRVVGCKHSGITRQVFPRARRARPDAR
jgi:hypothetical protein